MKGQESLQDLWDTIKRTNECILGLQEREERGKGSKSLFKEIMTENSSNPGKEIDIQIQVHEAQISSEVELKEDCTKIYHNQIVKRQR
jgi:hypothetical protein